jgi:heavy metal sensor kinase
MFRSLRWRLTGWYVLLLAGVLLAFSLGTYLAVRTLLHDNLDDSLDHQVELLAQAIAIEDDEPTLPREARLAERSNDVFMRLYRGDGTLVFADAREDQMLPELPESLAGALRGQKEYAEARVGTSMFRVATYPVIHDGQIVGALQIGLSMGDVEDALWALLKALLALAPTLLALASGGGLFLANRALAPIDRITRTAQRISAENLGGRISLHGPDDEVGRLARTFDAMLARLEAAFERQRRFTADASHELRTPLTAILGQIDVALERPREAETYRTTLTTIREQAQRLARLVGDLLFLARTDAQTTPIAVEPLDLSTLLQAAVDEVKPLAAARDQTIELAAVPLKLEGSEDHLLRLFLNLLDNAIRYTPPGGRIMLNCACDGSEIVAHISDTGPGIAPEHLPRLFERFHRVDRGRSRAQGGSGLGLAIAQSIAHAHGGRIAVESAVGQGSTFTVILPGAGEQEPPSPHSTIAAPDVAYSVSHND